MKEKGPEAGALDRPSRLRVGLLASGSVLIALSLFGFATVADDLRHLGEASAVASLLLAGIALLLASYSNPVSRRLNLFWLALGPVLGSLLGAIADQAPIGFGIGVALGLASGLTARTHCRL